NARFGDHRAAPAVADEDGRAVLVLENPRRRGDVVGERGEGVLHDAYAIAARGEFVIDAAPTGTVDEGAVHEDDIAHGLAVRNTRVRFVRLGAARKRRRGDGQGGGLHGRDHWVLSFEALVGRSDDPREEDGRGRAND